MNKTVVSLVITAIMTAAAWAWTPSGTTPLAYHGQLSVNGNKIVNQHGEPAVLRGMSLFWDCWAGSYYTADHVRTLASEWKVGIVRSAHSGSGNEPDCGAGGDRNRTITVVDAAKVNGIYAIIDWHSHSAHNGRNDERSKALAFFAEMANRYKDEKHVMYEIYNEPCPNNGGFRNQCTGDEWGTGTPQDIRPYLQAAVDTIRKYDKNNVILVGTPMFSQYVEVATANPLTGTNLAYVLHFYAGADPTHRDVLRGRASTALGRGYPIFITEFGMTNSDGAGAYDFEETEKWFEFSDRNFIGWANWSYSNMGGTSGALNNMNPGGGGYWIKNKLSYYATQITGVTVSAPGGGGTAAITTETPNLNQGGRYFPGQVLTLTATPNAGSTFRSWTINGPYKFVLSNATLNSNPVRIQLTSASPVTVTAAFGEILLLRNGTFDTDATGWNTQNSGAGSGASRTVTNGECRVTAANFGTARNSVRLEQTGISLVQNRKYRLSFKARAVSGTRTITPVVYQRSTRYNDTASVTLTSSMQMFSSEFNMCGASVDDAVVSFYYGNESGDWIIDDILLEDIGQVGAGICNSNVTSTVSPARSQVWSLVRVGGGLTLRGPAEHGATLTLYDTRGKLVKSVNAKSGQPLVLNSKVAPAGNYILVVRNGSGKEIYRTRAALAN
ncbi:MAG: cellulase family glycosylhydrolase [Chitinispirillales bacterium]|nr:cellulase family glycosylhydrolase [Chitinispirillales bacterium]